MSNFEPPYRRFAIRFTSRDGKVTWWTDDGTGTDEACDYTEWGAEPLVVYLTRDEAIHEVENRLRSFARARGMTAAVVSVWEYPGGVYELKKRSKD